MSGCPCHGSRFTVHGFFYVQKDSHRQPGRDRGARHPRVPRDGHLAGRRLLGGGPRGAARAPRRRGFLLGPAPSAESYLRIDRIVEAALRSGAEADPSRLRLPRRERRFRARGRATPGWPSSARSPEAMELMGSKTSARRAAAARRRARRPGHHRAARIRRRGARDGRARRLPRHAQGRGRRRRQGHAPRRGRGGARVGLRHGALRGAPRPSATRRSTSRRPSSARATSRSRSSPTRTATSSTSASASARSSAGTRRSSRSARRRSTTPSLRAAMGEAAVAHRARGRLRRRGHGRVPRLRRDARLLLP